MERTNVGGGRHLFYASLAVFLLLFALLPGCHDTLSVTDNVERQIDGDLAELEGVELLVWDADINDYRVWDGSDVFVTRLGWRWLGDEVMGEPVFRFRLGGGEWRVLTESDLTLDGDGYYRYTVFQDIYPGTYAFELQQRNAAGVWSAIHSHDVVILVRAPVITAMPGGLTIDSSPVFSWQQYNTPVQHGATGLFSYRLDRLEGGLWVPIADGQGIDVTATSYVPANPLPDGIYRFGVAERNDGGDRSAFAFVQFSVITETESKRTVLLVSPEGEEFVFLVEDSRWGSNPGSPASVDLGIYAVSDQGVLGVAFLLGVGVIHPSDLVFPVDVLQSLAAIPDEVVFMWDPAEIVGTDGDITVTLDPASDPLRVTISGTASFQIYPGSEDHVLFSFSLLDFPVQEHPDSTIEWLETIKGVPMFPKGGARLE